MVYIDKEKLKEIYPPNFRLDGDIQKWHVNEDGTIGFEGRFPLDGFEPYTCDGVEGLWNEEKRLFIPNEVAEQGAKSLVGAPILAPTPKIENIREFFEKRYSMLDCYFENDGSVYNLSTDVDVLKKYEDSETSFVFLSIDMVKSTELSLNLPLELNSIINNLFLNEIAIIIRGMGGYVYKSVGDELIAFFEPVNLLNKVDDSILCSDYIRMFILDYLNKFLDKKGFPKVGFRTSINYGDVYVKNVGDKLELNGYNLNATIKLQNFANDNEIILGSNVVKLAHKKWKSRMKKLKINSRKLKQANLHEGMKVYRLHNLEGRYD